jgi:hypothetical protein
MGAHTPADHLTVVAAKVDVLDEKVDGLTERVEVLTERVGVLEERVTILDVRVTALDEKVIVLDGKVNRLSDTMVAEFADVRHEMRLGFAALEYQIGASEDRMQKFVEGAIQSAVKASEEATHRHMRVLHEEVLERLKTLGEGRN